MTRPLIGITAAVLRARYGSWDHDTALVPADYVRAVDRAGGRPLVVPPFADASADGAAEVLDVLDGLVFSGGSDLDPALYGQEPHPETNGVERTRDRAELELLRSALDRELPLLAVCRGSQVLNVALGGELVQHLPDVVGHERHREVPGVFSDHEVAVEPGTRLHELLGDEATVKSHHHQAFGRLGIGLRPAAYASDGTLEAIEPDDGRFALGVLWHPEAGPDRRLFEGLVAEAGRRRGF